MLILYVPGLVTTTLAGTWEIYISDWRKFISTVFIGVIVWLLIRFLKRIDQKLQHVSQIISPPKREKSSQKGYEKWKSWERRVKYYKKWMHSPDRVPRKWYYFQAIGGAVGGFILSTFIYDPNIGWVRENLFNILYFHAWYIFLGFLTGASLFYIWTGFWAIRRYCKDVVSHREILPLDPDHTGGLRELGRLALDLDLIVAIPSILFPLYLSGEVKITEPWIGIGILYALTLVLVFFVSISPAHDDMVRAKTSYLLKIHQEYKDMHKKILEKLQPEKLLDPKEYKRLSGLYELYDRVESMAVWPLDFQTTLRFSITSLLPLITIGISISF